MKVRSKGEGCSLGLCVLINREAQGNKHFSDVSSQQGFYGVKLCRRF